MRRAVGAVLTVLIGGLLALPQAGVAKVRDGLEYGVKANYLVRFAAFVEWPSTAFASSTSPMVICVAGRDPFGRALDQAAEGQTAQNRPIVVRRLMPTPVEAAGCHILYAAPNVSPAYPAGASGQLLVSEAGGRGAIVFLIRGGRVRFAIDQAAARRSGLRMSSRLLHLAVSVRGP